MILEARIRKTEKGTVLIRIDDKEIPVRQMPGNEDYSNVYHNLRDGEKVFLNQTSRGEYVLVINFDNGMEDDFFQRMFGYKPPRRDDMTYYQARVVAAKNKVAQGYFTELLRDYFSERPAQEQKKD